MASLPPTYPFPSTTPTHLIHPPSSSTADWDRHGKTRSVSLDRIRDTPFFVCKEPFA